jgi:hydrogenase nickel incorporation protein HypA/HybF
MHEYGIAQQLLTTVERAAQDAGAVRVLSVNLALGVRSHVVVDSLQLFFDYLSKGGVAAGASLVAQAVPMRFFCPSCQCSYDRFEDTLACPECQTLGRLLEAGDDLQVISIDIQA